MEIAKRLPHRAIALVAVCAMFAVAAIGASSASAAIKWAQGENPEMVWVKNISLSVKKKGGAPVTCTMASDGYGLAQNSGGLAWGWMQLEPLFGKWLTCPGSKELWLNMIIEPTASLGGGKYRLATSGTGGYPMASPFGEYENASYSETATFLNGTVSTSSTITFNETEIGLASSGTVPLLLSGTVKVTTGLGKLLTLTGS
jgi:hypothetical protein